MAREQGRIEPPGGGLGFRLFRQHPGSLGMSWWSHGLGAARIGGELLGAGAACLVHAIVPAWFTQTAGKTVDRLHSEMVRRRSDASNPDEWPDYEI